MALIDIDTYDQLGGYKLPYGKQQQQIVDPYSSSPFNFAPDPAQYTQPAPVTDPYSVNPFTLQTDTSYSAPQPEPQTQINPYNFNPITLQQDSSYSEPDVQPAYAGLNNFTLQPDTQPVGFSDPWATAQPEQPSAAALYYGLAGDQSPEQQYGDLYPNYSGADLAGDVFGNATSGERFWGNVMGGANQPADVFGGLPGPLRMAADIATAPATLATLGTGGEDAALLNFGKNVGAGIGGVIGSKLAGEGTQAYAESGLPGADIAANPWVQTGAGLLGGLIGGGIGYGVAEDLPGTYRSFLGPEGKAVRAVEKVAPGFGGSIISYDDEIPSIVSQWNDAYGTPEGDAAFERLQGLIKDDKGRPVVLFHGTDKPNLTVLKPGESVRGTADGLFFTTDPNIAAWYGTNVHAVHVTDAGMLDLTDERSFAAFAKTALGLEGDELDDAVRWHEEGTLYNGYGSRGLQDDVVRTAKSLGFAGVVFNDSTSQFGLHPSYVRFEDTPVGSGFSGGAEGLAHPLTKGATVIDDTGKEWEVARKFTGDENGRVRVKDPETGETAAVERSRLSEPGALETSPVAPIEARGAAESAGVSSPPAAPPPTDILHLPALQPEPLSRPDRLMNALKRTIGAGTEEDTIATPAMRERERLKPIVSAQASRLSAATDTIVHDAFKPDGKGRIQSLPGAPTIQDVAARLPEFEPYMTAEQRTAIARLKAEVEPYGALLKSVGVEYGSRPDVMDGGFYLPRGRADVEGADAAVKVGSGRGGAGGKKGFERAATFDSMAQGIDAGYEYAPFSEAMASYGKDAGTRAVDQHVANYFKNAVDPETGLPLGQTPHARLLKQNPRIAAKVEGLRKSLESLRGTTDRLTMKQQAAIDEFLNSPAPDVDSLIDGIDAHVGLNAVGKAGPNFGKSPAELRQAIRDVRQQLSDIAPEWHSALEKARMTPRDQGSIGFAQLNGTTFPDEVANAANKYLAAERRASGKGTVLIHTTEAVNNLLRGLRASVDVSFSGIQGLLGAGRDPVAYGKAMGVAVKSMGTERALGAKILAFDEAALKAGRPTSREWIANGLHVGGADTEFQVGRGISGKVGSAIRNAPVIKQSNRAFGYFGDTLRLELADTMLTARRNGPEAMREIANSANLATGWSPHIFAGDVGQALQFAPRFFQSQLELAVKGIDPTNWGIEGVEAKRMLVTLMGVGALLTVAANEAAGDGGIPVRQYLKPFNGDGPIGDPRQGLNGNFMRFRANGEDRSLFGPWDSLLRAVVATAGGDPTYMLRTKASPSVALAWDLISGKTFTGENSRTPEALARNLLPFSVQNIGKGESLVNTAIGMTGLKASPTTPYEKRDQQLVNDPAFNDPNDPQSLRKDPNKPATWDNLSPKGYTLAKDKYGVVDSRNPDVTANREAKAETEANRLKQERDAAALHDAGGSGKAFREQLSDIQREAAIEKQKTDSIYQTFKDTGKLPTDPNDRALTQFYSLYDQARLPGGGIDWDKFDTLSAQLREGWTPAQAKYVDDQQGLTTHDPAVADFYAGREKLDASGFFDVKDDAWKYFVQQHPQLAEYKDYWDWHDKAQQWEYDQLIQQGVKKDIASQQAADNVAGLGTYTKFAEYSRTMFRHQWVVANPEQAVFAWEYGYFPGGKPDKQEQAWLTEHGYTMDKQP